MTLTVEQLDVAPEGAGIAHGGITTLPLDRLMLSGLNVRKTERDADIAALADDIAARGLKQNLVVIPAHFTTGEATNAQFNGEPAKSGGKAVWKDRFEVIAGGRRYQALQLLVEDGRLPADHPVPVLIEDRDAASETSLSENLHRVAMNPADEFDAFRTIVLDWMKIHAHAAWLSGGASDCPPAIEYCAKRFGKTPSYVAGRLRLAALAPEILDALRNDQIGLEAAKAYARVSDRVLQLKVFQLHTKEKWRGHNPRTIRDDLSQQTAAVDDRRMIYVGTEAYLAANGRIEDEMFMGTEGSERVLDVALLDRLVKEKAEAAIPALAKADGFKEGLFTPNAGQFPKPPKGFERAWDHYYGSKVTKAQIKKSIGVYALSPTGDGIEKVGRLKPADPPVKRDEVDWDKQRAEQQRQYRITNMAGRMAADFTAQGTVLEGKAFWPAYSARPIEDDPSDEAFVFVALQLRVARADVEAQMEAAEKKYDEEAVAAETEKAAKAAAAEAVNAKLDDPQDAGDDDLDGEFDEGEEEGGGE